VTLLLAHTPAAPAGAAAVLARRLSAAAAARSANAFLLSLRPQVLQLRRLHALPAQRCSLLGHMQQTP
jgi:hypothetical protein